MTDNKHTELHYSFNEVAWHDPDWESEPPRLVAYENLVAVTSADRSARFSFYLPAAQTRNGYLPVKGSTGDTEEEGWWYGLRVHDPRTNATYRVNATNYNQNKPTKWTVTERRVHRGVWTGDDLKGEVATRDEAVKLVVSKAMLFAATV